MAPRFLCYSLWPIHTLLSACSEERVAALAVRWFQDRVLGTEVQSQVLSPSQG